jgi:DNA-binding MarR family transcriptional regulator
MEAAGLIQRTPGPSNRRATLVRATAAGSAALDEAVRAYLGSSRHLAVSSTMTTSITWSG